MMRWTKKTPKVTGWWLIGGRRGVKWVTNIVEVREKHREFQWSFINGLTWQTVDNYPHYWWAGPIKTPKLPKR